MTPGREQPSFPAASPYAVARGGDRIMVLARDPVVLAAAHAAYDRVGRAPALVMRTGAEVLARLVAPGRPPRHLLCDPSAAGGSLPHLLATLSEPGSGTALILVSRAPPMTLGLATLPADIARLAEALAAPP